MQNPTHIFQNQSLFITNYNVSLIVSSANGCVDTANQVVSVYPEPIFPFSTNPDSGCSPVLVNFPAVVGAVQYQWDFGDGTTSTGPSPTHVFVNNTTNNQVFTVELIATSPFGCSDTTYRDVVVFPNPTADFSMTNNIGCPELTRSFQNLSTGADNYYWDFGNGSLDTTVVQSFQQIFDSQTQQQVDYPISLIAATNAGCYDTNNQVVTVRPRVVASFDHDSSGCSPIPVAFQNNSLGATSYFLDFGNGAASTSAQPTQNYTYTGTADTVYAISLIASSNFGCADTSFSQIEVFNTAQSNFTISTLQGCTPVNVTFNNTSFGYDSLLWQFGDNTASSSTAQFIANTYTNTTLQPEVYTINLFAYTAEGCNDTTSIDLTVFPPITANFSGLADGCSPRTISLTNQSTGANAYFWEFGDGITSVDPDPTHIFTNPIIADTTYLVELEASSQYGCSDSIMLPITIFNTPLVNATPSVISGCTPLEVTFSNASTGMDGLNWDMDDGTTFTSTAASYSHTFTNTGNTPQFFNVTLVGTTVEGCNDTLVIPIEVFPPVTASFSGGQDGCSPHTLQLTNTSSGASSYFWDFSNGTTSSNPNPITTFINNSISDTVYSIAFVATSIHGCSDTLTQDITVFNTPISTFSLSQQTACTPVSVAITNGSIGADSYQWDFGNGTTSNTAATAFNQAYVNTSVNPITYDLTLIAETVEGCADTATQNLTVYPPVVADFTGDSIGCSPLDVQFINTSQGAVTYLWDFGDGTTAVTASPNHSYQYSGATDTTYQLTLVATSAFGCSDTLVRNIQVFPQPIALFSANPTLQTWPSNAVTITNTTNGTWNYNWSFGDGNTSTTIQPGTINYGTWGQYTITAIIANAFCSDTASQAITILAPPPVASFIGSGEGFEPLTIQFLSTSQYATSWFWGFGDGNTSVAENPVYTYNNEGVYTVSLTVVGENGTSTMVKVDSVIVHPNANAFFDFRPEVVSVPLQAVQFFNQSGNATSFFWDFGDGNTSQEEFPQHRYSEVGAYTVTLIVDNEFGCADTFVAINPVIAEGGGDITYPNVFTPDPLGSSGGYYGQNNIENSIFFPVSEGVVEYHLLIYNRWGEVMFETYDVEQGWDGYYRGELCQQDVYVYKAEVRFINGSEETVVGDLTLLR